MQNISIHFLLYNFYPYMRKIIRKITFAHCFSLQKIKFRLHHMISSIYNYIYNFIYRYTWFYMDSFFFHFLKLHSLQKKNCENYSSYYFSCVHIRSEITERRGRKHIWTYFTYNYIYLFNYKYVLDFFFYRGSYTRKALFR